MRRAPDRQQRITIRWRCHGQADALIPALDHAYPVENDPCFDKVLKTIDEAELQVWGDDRSTDDEAD